MKLCIFEFTPSPNVNTYTSFYHTHKLVSYNLSGQSLPATWTQHPVRVSNLTVSQKKCGGRGAFLTFFNAAQSSSNRFSCRFIGRHSSNVSINFRTTSKFISKQHRFSVDLSIRDQPLDFWAESGIYLNCNRSECAFLIISFSIAIQCTLGVILSFFIATRHPFCHDLVFTDLE